MQDHQLVIVKMILRLLVNEISTEAYILFSN